VLELGCKVMEGTPAELRADPLLSDAYLGPGGRGAAPGECRRNRGGVNAAPRLRGEGQ
jgi:hypothetical protein